MRGLRRCALRLLNLLLQRRAGERLREEVEAHLAELAAENMRAGMAPPEAWRRARMTFGSTETVQEQYHSERSVAWIENLLLDTRYALRVLRRSPAATLIAILTLTLAIGANVATFGMLNTLVLQPLPVSHADQLYQLRPQQWASFKLLTTSYPAYRDYARRNTSFVGLAALDAYSQGELRWRNAQVRVAGDAVSGNYFDLLGVQPQAGRFFHAGDEHGADSAPEIVLSDALWRQVFRGDPRILGRSILLGKQLFTVLGVARPSFHGTERFTWPDYWMPIVDQGSDLLTNRAQVAVTVLGRLRPGVTPRQATDNLNAISAELAREFPHTDRGGAVRLVRPGLYGDDGEVIRGFLWSVSALALLVLAAACANLANLFAARVADRAPEFALRLALGSGRLRLVRQLMLEVLLISLAGGAAGLGCATAALHTLSRWRPAIGGHVTIPLDVQVCAAALALTVASALGFGLLPARKVWRGSPLSAMKSVPARGLLRWSARDLLLALQIAICALLVCASLVAVRGMQRLLHAPLGFMPQGAVLAFIDLSSTAQPELAQQAVLEAARALPGVTAVGAVSRTPMTGGMHGVPIFREGTAVFTRDQAALEPYIFEASPGYLGAAQTRLLAGRDFARSDTMTAPDVAVVNQTFAQKMWGNRPAVGRRFIVDGRLTQVVGVTVAGKYHDLEELPQPVVYLPFAQSGDADSVFVVRSPLPSGQLSAALARVVTAIAPHTPVSIEDWPQSIAGELFPSRAAAAALGFMGVLAAMLAATGIFGMAAYAVSRRRKEIGVRVALGASRLDVLHATLGRIAVLLGVGAVTGLFGAVLLGRLFAHIVYQAQPQDPTILSATVLLMLLLGLSAAAIPARRALAVDAATLLREQ